MGLLVDIVEPGSDTTNDGNTARRFFEYPKISAEIPGLDEILIHKFSITLHVLSCGLKVNLVAFRLFELQTAQLYVKHYGWYYMPVTVHTFIFIERMLLIITVYLLANFLNI